MRLKRIVPLAGLLALICAAPARASHYELRTDRGTACGFDVTVTADHLGGLGALPNVAYTAGSRCSYAQSGTVAQLTAGKLVLVGPLGLQLPGYGVGSKSAAAAGFACPIALVPCFDNGGPVPSIPLQKYYSQFSFNLAAPPGESWVAGPGTCTLGPVAGCAKLRSETVTAPVI